MFTVGNNAASNGTYLGGQGDISVLRVPQCSQDVLVKVDQVNELASVLVRNTGYVLQVFELHRSPFPLLVSLSLCLSEWWDGNHVFQAMQV